MNTLKTRTLETVIVELERNIRALEEGYHQALSNLSWLKSQMNNSVNSDELTGLLRRGAFSDKLASLLDESKTEHKEVHILMIDIDYFKKVNDTYGHQTGDMVLERVSGLIKDYLRPQSKDLAGRYGGEEIIVAVQASAAEARNLAENIRRAVEAQPMISATHGQMPAESFHVTLSGGLASSTEAGYDATTLIAKADAALYRAKRNGRNRVYSAEQGTPAVVVNINTNLSVAA